MRRKIFELNFVCGLIVATLFGCSSPTRKYKAGDVVFLKPDSVKVTIIDNEVFMGDYRIESHKGFGILKEFCSEEEIYGKEE